MTKIGALCLVTIGVWMVIELAVQFGHYNHSCKGGVGACRRRFVAASALHSCMFVFRCLHFAAMGRWRW
jgi:hypothetical protein